MTSIVWRSAPACVPSAAGTGVEALFHQLLRNEGIFTAFPLTVVPCPLTGMTASSLKHRLERPVRFQMDH